MDAKAVARSHCPKPDLSLPDPALNFVLSKSLPEMQIAVAKMGPFLFLSSQAVLGEDDICYL